MKRTMKWNKIVKESQSASLKDIESSYGKGVAKALVKYCNEKDKDIESVINNLKPDRVGLTEWDWFEKWAKRTLKLDIYGGFSDDWMDDLDKDTKEQDDSDDNVKDNDLSDGISSRKLSKNKRRKLSRGIPVHDLPTRADMMAEGSESMDPQYVIDWIGEEIRDCEWCADFTFDDYDPIIEIETTDGDKFEISVKKI